MEHPCEIILDGNARLCAALSVILCKTSCFVYIRSIPQALCTLRKVLNCHQHRQLDCHSQCDLLRNLHSTLEKSCVRHIIIGCPLGFYGSILWTLGVPVPRATTLSAATLNADARRQTLLAISGLSSLTEGGNSLHARDLSKLRSELFQIVVEMKSRFHRQSHETLHCCNSR